MRKRGRRKERRAWKGDCKNERDRKREGQRRGGRGRRVKEREAMAREAAGGQAHSVGLNGLIAACTSPAWPLPSPCLA